MHNCVLSKKKITSNIQTPVIFLKNQYIYIYIYIKAETSLCEGLNFCQVAPPMKFLYNHPTLPLIA